MLISRRDGLLVLVEQNEHGRLAGEFARHWGNQNFRPPDRRESVVLGGIMHDEGWREPDAAPLYNAEAKRPLYFLEIEREQHVELYRNGVERALESDLYAGLLVSMHWTGLYRARWGMQSGAVAFNQQTALQKLQDDAVAAEERRWIELKRELLTGVRSEFEAALWHSYDVIQACDLLSLYVSMSNLQAVGEAPAEALVPSLYSLDQTPGPRLLELIPTLIGGERTEINLSAQEDGVVVVDPYPFDCQELALELHARAIPDVPYPSEASARAAVDSAEDYTISCVMKGPR